MPTNIEVKAKVENLEGLLEKAKSLSGSQGISDAPGISISLTVGTILEQEDVFFNSTNGRLKVL